jgi:MarR family transcriptional regulator, organic hydroperoxide resistance regulator
MSIHKMQNFCKLKDLYKVIQELEKTIQEAHGLSGNECMAICSLSKCCSSAGELSDTLSLSKSRMSKILAALEQKNFIERNFDQYDKRKTQFVLTVKGLEKANEVENSPISIPDFEFKTNGTIRMFPKGRI